MNLFLILMTCLMTSFSISQGLKFELSEDKPTFPAYIVLEAENLPITQGYNSVLEWVNITYDTPEKVIKSKLDDKYIRISGTAPNLYAYDVLGAMTTTVKYEIEFKFQENRVKFDIIELQYYVPPSQYTSGGYVNLTLDYNKCFKKNGKPKKGYIKQANNVVNYFNDLSTSLKKHLNNPEKNFEEDEKW